MDNNKQNNSMELDCYCGCIITNKNQRLDLAFKHHFDHEHKFFVTNRIYGTFRLSDKLECIYYKNCIKAKYLQTHNKSCKNKQNCENG